MTLMLSLMLAIVIDGEWRSLVSSNLVNDICGDDSILYLATAGGVAVLDVAQEQIQTIRIVLNSEGLPVNNCLCEALDSAGNLWVGTDGGGLAVIPADGGFALHYRPSDVAPYIRSLSWAGNRLLVGSTEGLYVIDAMGTPLDFSDDAIRHFSTARVPELQSDNVTALLSHGDYWVGTIRGVTRVDTGFRIWRPLRPPHGDSARALAVLRDRVVVMTERGVSREDSSGLVPFCRFSRVREMFDMSVHGGDVYVAGTDGFYKVDTAESTGLQLIYQVDARAVLLGSAIWLGTGGDVVSGSGLRYLRSGQSWQSYYLPGLLSSNVNDLVAAPNGDVYCCHYSNGVSLVYPDRRVAWIWGALPNAVMVRVDSKGRAWFAHFASDGGLSAYDPVSNQWDRIQWGASSEWNVIKAFGLDQYDTKWMFNAAAAVVAVDSLGVQAVFNIPELVSPPDGNYEFAFDSRGRAWLGLTVGLEMIDFGGTLHDPEDDTSVLYTKGLPSPEVRSVAIDRRDHVWVATPQGAAVWDGDGFRVYTRENTGNQLLSNNLSRVRVDAADRVWLLSEAGLSVLDLVSKRWQSFTPQNSGLIGNPQSISKFYTGLDVSSARNEVIVGSRRGMSVFAMLSAPETLATELSVAPNPCILGVHDCVAIGNLPEEARVRVYTLSGEPVADLTPRGRLGRAVWYPGRAASGVYIFVVASPRGTRSGRLAVVRR